MNITAQEYIVWCVTTLTTLDDGPDFDHIQHQFKAIVEQLDHLQSCYDLPPYESPKGL